MKFKKNKIITDIKSFAIGSKKILAVKEKKVIDILNFDNEIINSNEKLQTIFYSKPYFYVNDFYGIGYLIINEEVKKYSYIKNIVSDDKILLSKKINREKITILFNPTSDTILDEIPFSSTIYLYTDNFFFFKDFKRKTIISAYDVPNNLLKWEFDLNYFGKSVNDWGEERDYEIEQFIGLYNSTLWLRISDFGGLIGLDSDTGELKYRLKVSDEFIGTTKIKSIKDGKVPFYNKFNLSLLDTGKIIGLAIDIYYEVDLTLDEPKVIAYGVDEEYQKFGINNQDINRNSVIQENLLYFYNHNQHIFAILNIETKKIIYVSDKIDVPDTQEAWGQLKDLKVSEDKVYVLDSTRTLHIFEQEPTESNPV